MRGISNFEKGGMSIYGAEEVIFIGGVFNSLTSLQSIL